MIVTPDGIRSDSGLVSLLGGAGGTDQGTGLSTVANVVNSMTTGLFDIRGQQPSNISDMDSLCSPLSSGTVGLVTARNTSCATNHQEPGYAWSLRSLGAGQVAFMTSGNFSRNSTDDPDWTVTTIPGDGVHNAGLRNFVHAACNPTPAPAPVAVPATSPAGLVLGAILLAIGAVFGIRRKSR